MLVCSPAHGHLIPGAYIPTQKKATAKSDTFSAGAHAHVCARMHACLRPKYAFAPFLAEACPALGSTRQHPLSGRMMVCSPTVRARKVRGLPLCPCTVCRPARWDHCHTTFIRCCRQFYVCVLGAKCLRCTKRETYTRSHMKTHSTHTLTCHRRHGAPPPPRQTPVTCTPVENTFYKRTHAWETPVAAAVHWSNLQELSVTTGKYVRTSKYVRIESRAHKRLSCTHARARKRTRTRTRTTLAAKSVKPESQTVPHLSSYLTSRRQVL